MAVVFGDKTTEDGWLRVTCIQWQMDSHENGYSVNAEDIPDYPKLPRGKSPVPKISLHTWDAQKR
jgi:hypothetical protein